MTYQPLGPMQAAIDNKANSSTVGGISTKLNALADTVGAKATQASVTALAATIPVPASEVPQSESKAGAAGIEGLKVSGAGHQHPRLTSTTYGALKANGLSDPVMFTRNFSTEPGAVLTAVMPGGTQPVALQIDSWVMSGALYAGCVVRGYRSRPLPTMQPLSLTALLTAVVTGVNAVISVLSTFDVFGGSVAGVRFSCIAVQRSDT